MWLNTRRFFIWNRGKHVVMVRSCISMYFVASKFNSERTWHSWILELSGMWIPKSCCRYVSSHCLQIACNHNCILVNVRNLLYSLCTLCISGEHCQWQVRYKIFNIFLFIYKPTVFSRPFNFEGAKPVEGSL